MSLECSKYIVWFLGKYRCIYFEINRETHENLDAYLTDHRTKENIYLLICVSLPSSHEELVVEKLPVFSSLFEYFSVIKWE